jgi:hypothetical protein
MIANNLRDFLKVIENQSPSERIKAIDDEIQQLALRIHGELLSTEERSRLINYQDGLYGLKNRIPKKLD